MFFSFYIKEKLVGPVKVLQDQFILGVTGPTGPVTVLVSAQPWFLYTVPERAGTYGVHVLMISQVSPMLV